MLGLPDTEKPGKIKKSCWPKNYNELESILK